MSSAGQAPAGGRTLAVIVNPTKFDDLERVRARIAKRCVEAGWAEPLWFETTAEDPGVGQAQAALEQGASIVCPLGGDGTVRAVATSLLGSETPLGLLPGGTGNLLARNLELPIDKIEDALDVVLTGRSRPIDVGLVRLFPNPQSPEPLLGSDGPGDGDPRRDDEEVFLVMAGIGVDAEVMAGTSEKVKGVIGWFAYVLAGIARLWNRGFRITVSGGGRASRSQRAHSVVIGNCGTLQGNVQLMPDALLDDGRLDGVVMAPNGVFGWLSVAVDVVTRHRRGTSRMSRLTGTSMSVRVSRLVETQIDGDPMGPQHGFTVRVLPGTLVVRVPAEPEAVDSVDGAVLRSGQAPGEP